MLLRRNRKIAKLTGRKTRATMTASILALTCMPGVTICGQTPHRTTRVFIDGREVKSAEATRQQSQPGGRRTTSVKWKDDQGHGAISAKDVELTTDLNDISSIAKDGYLVIDETRDGIRRRIKIEPLTDGKLKRTYSVNGVAREIDEAGQAWLARILHDFLDSSRQ